MLKKVLFGEFAFSVFIVTAVVPDGIAGVSVSANVIGNIGDYKLGVRNAIALVILKIIMVKFADWHLLHPPFLQ